MHKYEEEKKLLMINEKYYAKLMLGDVEKFPVWLDQSKPKLFMTTQQPHEFSIEAAVKILNLLHLVVIKILNLFMLSPTFITDFPSQSDSNEPLGKSASLLKCKYWWFWVENFPQEIESLKESFVKENECNLLHHSTPSTSSSKYSSTL